MGPARFGSRQRTALVLTGEGTSFAYLAGVLKALEAAGVRIDLVLGRGAGAVVACFAAVNGRKSLSGDEGLVATLGKTRPYRLLTSYRVAALCLLTSAVFFLSPALVGLVSLVALPVRAILGWVRIVPTDGGMPSWIDTAIAFAERFYLPAIAMPIVVWFGFLSFRWLASALQTRSLRLELSPAAPRPWFDLAPLARAIETHLWPVVRGASQQDRPPGSKELGQAFRKLLTGSFGQHGFRELVFYALDSESGREVPFVLVKDRFLKVAAGKARPSGAKSKSKSNGAPGPSGPGLSGIAEPLDLAGEEGADVFFDGLIAAVSPPNLVESVPLRMPLGSRFGGEVHHFSSSLVFGGGTVADAVALGAEQIIYAIGSAPSETLTGSAWERQSSAGLRRTLAEDLHWAEEVPVPVFVVRPQKERLRPFELSGRKQGSGRAQERLTLEALEAQGVRDAERLFVEPILGESDGDYRAAEQTVPVREALRKEGPEEL